MPTEQERALQYRLDAQAREDAKAAREKSMAGDPTATRELLAAWSPLRRWEGWDPEPKGSPDDAK